MSSRLNPSEYDLAELRAALDDPVETVSTDPPGPDAAQSVPHDRDATAEPHPAAGSDTDSGPRPRHPPAGGAAPTDRSVPAERRPRDASDGARRLPSWCSNVTVERPYLATLPDGFDGEALVLDWMAFLLGRAGRDGAREALAHYRSVGWISERVEESLATHVEGLATDGSAAASPGVDDHRQSLLFVARLAAIRE
jgi:hypothetical protein